MQIPIWVIVLCSPLLLIGVVICILAGFSFLDLLDEWFGIRLRGHSRGRENAREHTVIENVIVKKRG